jgi:hypothetical protein
MEEVEAIAVFAYAAELLGSVCEKVLRAILEDSFG